MTSCPFRDLRGYTLQNGGTGIRSVGTPVEMAHYRHGRNTFLAVLPIFATEAASGGHLNHAEFSLMWIDALRGRRYARIKHYGAPPRDEGQVRSIYLCVVKTSSVI
jgi:hypothetical protein